MMRMSQDASVVASVTLSVGGEFNAPNIYDKSQVDSISSSKTSDLINFNLVSCPEHDNLAIYHLFLLLHKMEQSIQKP